MGSKVLLIEDDRDLREIVDDLLTSEGFEVTAAASHAEALAALERARFDLVVADFIVDFENGAGWEVLQPIRDRAAPTPVGIVSGWMIDELEAQRRGYVFALPKPFSSMKLLAAVAAHATAPPLSEDQRRLFARYFAVLELGEWTELGSLCTDDVEYHLPGDDPRLSRTVSGRDELVAFAEETFRGFRAPRFELQELIALPAGGLVRYQSSWDAGGQRASAPGAVVFELRGDAIARIGIRVDAQAIGALAAGASAS
jgi:CheY-like chemotaxis protein/ketosteroid isomerase-like protein